MDLGNDTHAVDREAAAEGAFDGGRDRKEAEPRLAHLNQKGLIIELAHDPGGNGLLGQPLLHSIPSVKIIASYRSFPSAAPQQSAASQNRPFSDMIT